MKNAAKIINGITSAEYHAFVRTMGQTPSQFIRSFCSRDIYSEISWHRDYPGRFEDGTDMIVEIARTWWNNVSEATRKSVQRSIDRNIAARIEESVMEAIDEEDIHSDESYGSWE